MTSLCEMMNAFLVSNLPSELSQVEVGLNFTLPYDPAWNEGGVYGFCALLSEVQLKHLIEEAETLGTISQYVKRDGKRANAFDESRYVPLETGSAVYPLYWGKDQGFRSRLKSHISNELTSTGSLYLGSYESLKGINIGYSAVLVSDRATYEYFLQKKFPPLLQTQKIDNLT